MAGLGKYPLAINDYDIAIQLKSDFAEAYFNRGLAKYILKHVEEAKQDFQKALRLAQQTGDEYLKAQIEVVIQDLD